MPSNTEENIQIVVLGPVSAGKSTFLNGLFSTTFSDMKRKKTTMLPQVYQIINNKKDIDTDQKIIERNRESNKKILELRDRNEYKIIDEVITHRVAPIDDFLEVPDKNIQCTYQIIDMPGLNCGGDAIYYDYIRKTSQLIDIYILLFDINSGLNTTDEINILNLVNDEIKKNGNGYVHVIMNKCDDISYDINNENPDLKDDELEELWYRSKDIVEKHLKDVPATMRSISAMCSSKLYVARGAKHNIESLDEKAINDLISYEVGKRELDRLKTITAKQKFIRGLIKKEEKSKNYNENLYGNWMKTTGYSAFQKGIKRAMTNYFAFVTYHIFKYTESHCESNITNNASYTTITNAMECAVLRLDQLKKVDKNYKIPELLMARFKKVAININNYITAGFNGSCDLNLNMQSLSDVNKWISECKKFKTNYHHIFNKDNFVETSLEMLIARRYLLLNNEIVNNFDVNILEELSRSNTLNMKYYLVGITNELKKSSSKEDRFINLVKKINNINSEDLYIQPIFNTFISTNPSFDSKVLIHYITEICIIMDMQHKRIAKYIIQLVNAYLKDTSDIHSNHHNEFNTYFVTQLQNQMLTNQTSSSECQYIYYMILQMQNVILKKDNYAINYNNTDSETFPDFNKYEKWNNIAYTIIDSINMLFIDNKEINDNSSENQNEIKMIFPKDEKEQNIRLIDEESNNDDTQLERYDDSDDSETTLSKAVNNANLRTTQIVSNNIKKDVKDDDSVTSQSNSNKNTIRKIKIVKKLVKKISKEN